MILDTNAVSALFQGARELERVLSNAQRHHVPVVVLGEYRYGIAGSSRRAELECLLAELEQESRILDVDRQTAHHYAEIRHTLRTNGTPIPENDIWIAALAVQHGLPVVTRDRHLDHVSGVRTVSW